MKIIVKPLGVVVCAGLVVAGIAIPQFRPQTSVYVQAIPTKAPPTPAPNLAPAANWLPFEAEGGVHASHVLKELPPGCTEVGGIHLEAVKIGKVPWSVGYNQTIAAEFANNELVTLTFWARAKKTQMIRIALQHPKNNYHESWSKEQTLTPTWEKLQFTFPTEQLPFGEASLAFQTGSKVGWVELAGITLVRSN